MKLLCYDRAAGLSDPLYVSLDEAEQRLDYDYHIVKRAEGQTIGDFSELGADIKRGLMSTAEAAMLIFQLQHVRLCQPFRR